MKVLILHGWGGSDYPHWQAHLAMEIAKNYGTVSFPLIQHPHYPSKNRWLKQLDAFMRDFKPDTVVCHSLANTLWFHYRAQPDAISTERLFLVSPPSLTTQLETLSSFFPCALPDDIGAKRTYVFVSDDDPYITVDEAERIAEHIGATTEVLHKAGHINADSGFGKWERIETLVLQNEELE